MDGRNNWLEGNCNHRSKQTNASVRVCVTDSADIYSNQKFWFWHEITRTFHRNSILFFRLKH